MQSPVLVSACLLGLKTRYDGADAYSQKAVDLLKKRAVVPVCPEQLGGLPTPRPRAEISSGDGVSVLEGISGVIDEFGSDATAFFLKGAHEVLKIARIVGAKEAYLKEKSPSCGTGTICRDSVCVPGPGVTAALLKKEGLALKGF
ncbi:MAG: DUF523 domain-containing protein [Deltaproteobacteria bacterium]|nr:DUF523 domain-containing protein [Deltaproteobacteria bacterium]